MKDKKIRTTGERKRGVIIGLLLLLTLLLSINNSSDFQGKSDTQNNLAFDLEKSNARIKIRLANSMIISVSDAKLVHLSEEELLAESYQNQQLATFSGEVKAIHNINISFSQVQEYWSIVEIEVIEDFRTELVPGSIVSVKIPGHILDEGGSNSIMDTAGILQVGNKVIMMPTMDL